MHDRTLPRLAALGLALAALGAGTAAPAAAQAVQTAKTGAVMTVPLNKSQVLKLDRAYAKATVGNPEIADVVPLTLTSIYVLGRASGTTNLALFDRAGAMIAVVDVVVGPDVITLKRQISDSFPGEDVRVRNSNDTLVLEGVASTPLVAERITAMAETFAPQKVLNMMSVGSPQQVLLEVRISEMTRDTVKALGIQSFSWANSSSSGGIVGATGSTPDGAFRGSLALFNSGIQVDFEALESKGLIRTLAQPNLVALSGETASFLVGGEFPVPTGISPSGQIIIEFKQFGVALAFTPTVLTDGMVNLRVAPEVSQIDREASILLQNIEIPGLRVRRAVTSLELRDGQSFAMAGLIQSNFRDSVRAIPALGRIPIIGALFRSTSFEKQETELVITVTPRFVKPVRPGDIVVPTDRVKPPGDFELFLFGKTERRVPLEKAAEAAAATARPGGINGDFGHIVR